MEHRHRKCPGGFDLHNAGAPAETAGKPAAEPAAPGRHCMRLEVGSSMAGVEMEFYGYPLVNVIFNGKIHYFDWAMFNSELLNYQRVL